MAGLAPFFITGANAKIKLNNKTMAFAQDFSYSVLVKHASPKVLGVYEVDSLEPLSYEVSGSFSIIRYARGATEAVRSTQVSGPFQRTLPDGTVQKTSGTSNLKAPNSVNNDGNGIGAWGTGGTVLLDSDGRADENLDPGSMKYGTWFDIEIWQKLAGGKQCAVARLRKCRIERADFSIAGKTSPAIQRFTFKAIFLDEDTFKANFSGTGQQFS